MTPENAMVEDQVEKPMRVADENPFLAGLETEAVTEFEQEFLQLIQKLVFEM
jgi:hypothetical protein